MKKRHLIYISANVLIFAGCMLATAGFSWLGDAGAAVLMALLLSATTASALGRGTLMNRVSGVLYLASISYLVAISLAAVPYWWRSTGTVLIVGATFILGAMTISFTLSNKPENRNESTHNFLEMVMLGVVMAALSLSFISTVASRNYTIETYPMFSILFTLVVLFVSWLRYAPALGGKIRTSLRFGGSAALLLVVVVGVDRFVGFEDAYAEAKEMLARNDVAGAKNRFLMLAGNRKSPEIGRKSRIELARIALAEADFDAAMEHLARIPKKNPETRKLRAEVALALLEHARENVKSNPEEAASDADKAVKCAPFSAKILAGAGRVYDSLSKPKEALVLYKRATGIEPRKIKYWQTYFDALVTAGEDEKAANVVEKVPSVKIKDDDARLRVGRMLFLTGRNIRAKSVLLAFGRSGNAEGLYWLGRAADALGNYETAKTHFEKSVQLDNAWADGLYRIGKRLEERGNPKEAVSFYKRTLKIIPNHFQANRGCVSAENIRDEFYTEYKEFKTSNGSKSIRGYFSLQIPKVEFDKKITLKLKIIIVKSHGSDKGDIKFKFGMPWMDRIYYYVIEIGKYNFSNIQIGESLKIEMEIDIPASRPVKHKINLAFSSYPPVDLGYVDLKNNPDYSKTSVNADEMLCIHQYLNEMHYGRKGRIICYTKGRIFFPLVTKEGNNKLVMSVFGTPAAGELPEFNIYVDGNRIYTGSIKSTEEHDIAVSFKSGGGLKWFEVEFINDYRDKKTCEDRNLGLINAVITDG